MKNHKHRPFTRILNNQKGVSAILVAILLPVLIGFAALAIDVGYMYTTRNELQNVADAAALAGASELGRIYLDMNPNEHEGYVLLSTDKGLIQTAATNVAERNKAAGGIIEINTEEDSDDVSIGVWDFATSSFTAQTNSPDAVRVIARRDSSINDAVTTFFARILSIFGGDHDTFESRAVATAALSGSASVAEGVLVVPFGISDTYFATSDDCPENVYFNSNDDCTRWHNFDYGQQLNTTIPDKMLGFIKDHAEGAAWLETHFSDYYTSANNSLDDIIAEPSPGVSAGDEFYFSEGVGPFFPADTSRDYIDFDSETGTVTHTSEGSKPAAFNTLYQFFRFRDGDDDDSKWSTFVPVYSGCDKDSKWDEIIGFAEIEIRRLYTTNDPVQELQSSIDVKIVCEIKYLEGRSGGSGISLLKGTIPNLVE